MKQVIAIVFLLMAAQVVNAASTIPHSFQSGQPARASDVNENFSYLHEIAKGSIGTLSTSRVSAQGAGVAGNICPDDSLAISVSCECSDENGTRNFGVLFGCEIAGNGGIAGCFSHLFTASLPAPLAKATVQCLSGATNDGEPLTTFLFPLSVSIQTISDKDKMDQFNKKYNEIHEQVQRHDLRASQ